MPGEGQLGGGCMYCYKRAIEATPASWLPEDYHTVVHKKVILPALFILTVLIVHAPHTPIPGIDLCLCPNYHVAQTRQLLLKMVMQCLECRRTRRGSLLISNALCCQDEDIALKPGANPPSPLRVHFKERGSIWWESIFHSVHYCFSLRDAAAL